ncbi:MAG: ROK family protein [Bacteroidota bacterium]
MGGSGIKGAPVDIKKGTLLADRHRIPTPQPATPKAVARTVAAVMEAHEWSGPLGCTVPARVRNGVTETATNIDSAWRGHPAAKTISKATGHPAVLINDADAAGIAEMTFGAGKKQKGKVLMLTFGTGIGSALFLDGQLVPNVELGSARWQKKMILEEFASDRARTRNHLTWERWAKKRVQPVLQHLEFLLSPDLIIIGGGVSKPEKWARFSDLLRVDARLRPAALGNEAGIVGAAYVASQQLGR